jgi:ATP-dependent Lhr-like helicase
MLSLGVVKKWSEAWVEAAVPPAEPWNIVAQQALVAVLEHDEIPIAELVALLCGAFPELAGADVLAAIDFLIDEDYLVVCDGVINIGEKTEQTYGRGHYRDLLASFSGSTLLTGRHGASEVGFIDPTALTGEKEDRKILLAGRSWKVTDVDWSKRIAWLEPAKEGGKARWLGGARSLSHDICQAIKSVLAGNPIDNVTLSKRSKDALHWLKEELPVNLNADFLTTETALKPSRTWTFSGTKHNRTVAMNASSGGPKIKFDALSVHAPINVISEAYGKDLHLSDEDFFAISEGIKFADCVHKELKKRMVITRYFSPL